ncbi:MAG: hypothetical protein DWQ42_06425 [Planctomycetota bacterium]|nr:MAG: hypothetical protein DWQ42_06425 [Planctomycetota bacterium]REK40355.1 MAG: hypothetical protein DWQ46_16655 [Planctomycetota bacterium]
MKLLYVVAAIVVTMLCWGIYGPVLHYGQDLFAGESKIAMDDGLRAFMCVGLAYFLIAIVVPVTMLQLYGEQGHWSGGGTFWSLIAGAAGALGALGVILAFGLGGRPVVVMPLVFGGAPVVNSFLTMYWLKSFRQISPIFIAGLIMVALGAVTVLLTRPSSKGPSGDWFMNLSSMIGVLLSIALIIVCWGAYGPVLHRGQMQMGGSRLRPLICVGVAYFVIAVVAPLMILSGNPGDGSFVSFGGVLWSVLAGAAGALGALGIIYAFNFGGKPIYVMPLVFGGAPVVNTLTSIVTTGATISPFFYAGLILVIVGAVIVLVWAPKGHGPPAAPSAAAAPSAPAANESSSEAAAAGVSNDSTTAKPR